MFSFQLFFSKRNFWPFSHDDCDIIYLLVSHSQVMIIGRFSACVFHHLTMRHNEGSLWSTCERKSVCQREWNKWIFNRTRNDKSCRFLSNVFHLVWVVKIRLCRQKTYFWVWKIEKFWQFRLLKRADSYVEWPNILCVNRRLISFKIYDVAGNHIKSVDFNVLVLTLFSIRLLIFAGHDKFKNWKMKIKNDGDDDEKRVTYLRKLEEN